MGIIFRQSLKTSIVIALGAALGGVINIVYTHILGNRDLGFINNVIAVCALMQMFVQLGTASLLSVFIQRYGKDDEKRRVLFTVSIFIPAVTIALLCIPFFLFKSHIIAAYNPADRSNLETFYYLIPINIFLWSYMTLFELFLVSQSKTALSTFMREIVLRVCNILLIVLYFLKLINFNFFVTGLLLIYIIPSATLFAITLRLEKRIISFNHRIFTKKEFREMFHFAWYHLFLFASQYLIGNLDLMILGLRDHSGMASGAVYKLAVFLLSLVLIPNTAMAAATWPMLNKAYINKDHLELESLFKRSAINILLLTLGTAVLLFCNLHNVVMFLGKDKGYEQLIPIFTILMVGRLIDIATGLNNDVLSVSSYYKFSFRVSLVLVIVVFVFDYTMVPQYSIYGAAWGSTIGYAVFNIMKMIIVWRKLKLQPFSKNSLVLLLAVIPALAVGIYLPFMVNKYVDLIVRSAIIVTIYGGMLLWLKPSPDLGIYLANIKKNKRLF